MVTVSIHQPNFCPRLSFFQKIADSDIFVLLTHCQFSNSAYQHRFNVGEKIYSMSVERNLLPIVETRYKSPDKDWEKITATHPKLKRFDNYICPHLSVTNHAIIIAACDKLGIHTQIIRDEKTELTGTARLVDICKKCRATKYLSGVSGLKYLDISLFEAAGIEVIFQDEKKMDKRALVEVL